MTRAAELGLPGWGTADALLWGVAHPDNPLVSPGTAAKCVYPDGSYWTERFPNGVPTPAEVVGLAT